MSAREQVEWSIYAHTRPFGQEQEDRRAALIAHTMASVFAGKKAPDLSKFLLVLRPEPPKAVDPQSPDVLRSRMLEMANKGKGKPKRPNQEPHGDNR